MTAAAPPVAPGAHSRDLTLAELLAAYPARRTKTGKVPHLERQAGSAWCDWDLTGPEIEAPAAVCTNCEQRARLYHRQMPDEDWEALSLDSLVTIAGVTHRLAQLVEAPGLALRCRPQTPVDRRRSQVAEPPVTCPSCDPDQPELLAQPGAELQIDLPGHGRITVVYGGVNGAYHVGRRVSGRSQVVRWLGEVRG